MAHLCAIESPFRARLVRITLQENPSVAAIAEVPPAATIWTRRPRSFCRTFSDLRARYRRLPGETAARWAWYVRLFTRTLGQQRFATRWKPC